MVDVYINLKYELQINVFWRDNIFLSLSLAWHWRQISLKELALWTFQNPISASLAGLQELLPQIFLKLFLVLPELLPWSLLPMVAAAEDYDTCKLCSSVKFGLTRELGPTYYREPIYGHTPQEKKGYWGGFLTNLAPRWNFNIHVSNDAYDDMY